jgi:hypothetical protein
MGKIKIKTMFDYVNEYFKLFLESNNVDEDVLSNWESEENLSNLDKMLKGCKKKEDKKQEKKDKKKNKHKDEPKKPLSPYICFCTNMRNKVVEDFPDLDNKSVMTKLGELWKSLSDDEKEEWNEAASDDKKRYEKEMAEFYDSHPEEVKKPVIKKPLTAYVIFCNETRNKVVKENPKLDPKEVMSKLGKLWKAESEDSKKKWVKLSEKDKERYKKQLSGETTDSKDEEVLVEEEKPQKASPKAKKTTEKKKVVSKKK